MGLFSGRRKENLKDIADSRRAEEELRTAILRAEEEKAKSEAIIAAIGDGISIQDTDFKVLYQNQVHKDFVGDHVGEYCYQVYAKRDDVCEGCPVAASFEDGKIHTTERSAPTDRGISYFEITASPLKDSTGKIIAGIEVVRDITERKKVEEALKEGEERFRQIAENVKEVFWLMDAKNYQMIYVNPAYEKIYGRSRNQLFENPKVWMESIHQNDKQRVYEAYKKQHRGEKDFDEEYRILTPDGEIRWIWARAFIIRNESGEVYRVAGLAEDITERKKVEEALVESESRYRTLFEKSPDSVTLVDKSGIIIDCNKSTEKLIGYSKEEILGKPFDKLLTLDPKDLPRLNEIYKKLSDGLEVEPYELEIIRKGGEKRWINVTNSLLMKDDVVVGFQVISRDITERKKSEEELNKKVEELEKWYKFTVDRETKMIELKKEIKELKDRLKKYEAS